MKRFISLKGFRDMDNDKQISIVGTLELASKYRYGLTSRGVPLYLFHPYDDERPDYVVGSTERDISQNQLAIVTVPLTMTTTTLVKPRGVLVRLLGPVGNYEVEKAALLQHYCPYRQKTCTSSPLSADSEPYRREISAATGWITIHVDPSGCRDIDDAIAWNQTTGEWAITIADASAAIPMDSEIDTTAVSIGQTFYDIHGTVVRSMLPPEVCASLTPGQKRRGVSLIWSATEPEHFELSWICVEHSFTYETVLDSEIARSVGITGDSHEWIAAQMIRYNCAAATLLKATGQGLLRCQPEAVWSSAINPIIKHLAYEAAEYVVSMPNLEQRHASLNVAAYCHATSPLRRYADLINQRVLKALIAGAGAVPAVSPDLAAHLNERTRAARRWTRDLTFLEFVVPGRVFTIDVIWISPTHVWVPLWGCCIRIRHTPSECTPGQTDRINIFCDPTKRNWKRRVLTAPIEVIVHSNGTSTSGLV